MGTVMFVIGLFFVVISLIVMLSNWDRRYYDRGSLIASSFIVLVFGSVMLLVATYKELSAHYFDSKYKVEIHYIDGSTETINVVSSFQPYVKASRGTYKLYSSEGVILGVYRCKILDKEQINNK